MTGPSFDIQTLKLWPAYDFRAQSAMTAVTQRRDGHHNQVAEGKWFWDQFLALDGAFSSKKQSAGFPDTIGLQPMEFQVQPNRSPMVSRNPRPAVRLKLRLHRPKPDGISEPAPGC